MVLEGVSHGMHYLNVEGVDMNGERIGPLRLRDHEEGDLEVGNICILRGLKVSEKCSMMRRAS